MDVSSRRDEIIRAVESNSILGFAHRFIKLQPNEMKRIAQKFTRGLSRYKELEAMISTGEVFTWEAPKKIGMYSIWVLVYRLHGRIHLHNYHDENPEIFNTIEELEKFLHETYSINNRIRNTVTLIP